MKNFVNSIIFDASYICLFNTNFIRIKTIALNNIDIFYIQEYYRLSLMRDGNENSQAIDADNYLNFNFGGFINRNKQNF